jgi:hypothetical protein
MQMTLELQDDALVETISPLGPIETESRDRPVMLDQESFSSLARRH